MLQEYEEDYDTGMDIGEMAKLLYDYTSGYPYLVSRLCKLIDEDVCGKEGFDTKEDAWSRNGFHEAVKMILADGVVAIANRLFETRLYNFYLSAAEMQDKDIYAASLRDKNQFWEDKTAVRHGKI